MPDIFVAKDAKKKKTKPVQLKKKAAKKYTKKRSPKALAKRFSRHKLPGHTHNPLVAFSYLPDKTHFINQDPEEKVILLLRKHPITNLRWILIATAMVLAPLLLGVFPIIEFMPERFQLIVIISWYLLTLAFGFEGFLGWFFNVYIITDERIVDVDFVNLVYREITDANIDQIQDVTVEVGGVIRTVFNYGDLVIQTAAEIPQIEFLAVPEPDKVSRVLRDLRIEEEEEKLEGRVR